MVSRPIGVKLTRHTDVVRSTRRRSYSAIGLVVRSENAILVFLRSAGVADRA